MTSDPLGGLQGLLPCVAPLLPHLAEDAWDNLSWSVPTKSVFQAGWLQLSADWTSLAQVRHALTQELSVDLMSCQHR